MRYGTNECKTGHAVHGAPCFLIKSFFLFDLTQSVNFTHFIDKIHHIFHLLVRISIIFTSEL